MGCREKTTRVEDRAYSLMGLFNINMPLLYGEGNRAFFRLQEELMKVSADETLFAWEMRSIPDYPGLLAYSPDNFVNSALIDQHESLIGSTQRTTPFSVTNMGLRMEVMLLKACDTRGAFCIDGAPFEWTYEYETTYIIVLNCHNVDSKGLIGITGGFPVKHKESRPKNQFVRFLDSPIGGLVLLDPKMYKPSDRDRTTIFAATGGLESSERMTPNRIGISNIQWFQMGPQGFRLVETWPPDLSWASESPFFPRNIALLFDNGEDTFTVQSTLGYERSSVINVSLNSPGSSLREEYKKKYTTLEIDKLVGTKSDRISYKLSSGRMVHVSLRPRQVGHNVGYGLHVAVDEQSLFYYNRPASGFLEI
jgi:hypothetical protein